MADYSQAWQVIPQTLASVYGMQKQAQMFEFEKKRLELSEQHRQEQKAFQQHQARVGWVKGLVDLHNMPKNLRNAAMPHWIESGAQLGIKVDPALLDVLKASDEKQSAFMRQILAKAGAELDPDGIVEFFGDRTKAFDFVLKFTEQQREATKDKTLASLLGGGEGAAGKAPAAPTAPTMGDVVPPEQRGLDMSNAAWFTSPAATAPMIGDQRTVQGPGLDSPTGPHPLTQYQGAAPAAPEPANLVDPAMERLEQLRSGRAQFTGEKDERRLKALDAEIGVLENKVFASRFQVHVQSAMSEIGGDPKRAAQVAAFRTMAETGITPPQHFSSLVSDRPTMDSLRAQLAQHLAANPDDPAAVRLRDALDKVSPARERTTQSERYAEAKQRYQESPTPENKRAFETSQAAWNAEVDRAAAQARSRLDEQPLPEGTQQALSNIEQTLGVITQLERFTPEQIAAFTGLINRPAQEVKQALKGIAPGVFGTPDEAYARFKPLIGRLQGTAFGEGGKALTAIELSVLNQYIPTGREPGGSVEVMEKVRSLKSFLKVSRMLRYKLATTGRGHINPEEFEQLLTAEMERAGIAATPAPVRSPTDTLRRELGK